MGCINSKKIMNIYIYDLDDTLYPSSSIDKNVGLPILNSLKNINKTNNFYSSDTLSKIFSDCWKIPLDEIIYKYNLPKLFIVGIKKEYENLILNQQITLFPYAKEVLLKNNGFNYLVTTGFEKLQRSKIKSLGINKFFNEIYIDNPLDNFTTKKTFFNQIIYTQNLSASNTIVIGDNLNSEIMFANELELTTIWVNHKDRKNRTKVTPNYTVSNLGQLLNLLNYFV